MIDIKHQLTTAVSYDFLTRKLRDALPLRKIFFEESHLWETLGVFNDVQTEYRSCVQETIHCLQWAWDEVDLLVGQLELSPCEKIDVRLFLPHAIPPHVASLVEQHLPRDLPTIWADRVRLRHALWTIFLQICAPRECTVLLSVSCDTTWITLKILGKGNYVVHPDEIPIDVCIAQAILEGHGGQLLEKRGEHERVFTLILPIHSSE